MRSSRARAPCRAFHPAIPNAAATVSGRTTAHVSVPLKEVAAGACLVARPITSASTAVPMVRPATIGHPAAPVAPVAASRSLVRSGSPRGPRR